MSINENDLPTALVTGSARRVGRIIAHALVNAGWRVIIHARSSNQAARACSELGAHTSFGADLGLEGTPGEFSTVAKRVLGEFGGLDLLVNNAASFERVTDWDAATLDSWARSMNINARAPYFVTSALLPWLERGDNGRGGLVVNISDRAAHEHWPHYPTHAASKAALESLTLSGARALAPRGIRMVAIVPGTILPPDDWTSERIEKEREVRGIGDPNKLANTILRLTHERARTGEIIG